MIINGYFEEMAPKFYKISVKKVIRETKDAVSIVFDIPNDLQNEFQYRAGQYLTIKVPVDDRDNRRAYSISTSPMHDEDIAVTVKKVDSGCVSIYLNENVKAGDVLELMPPMGNFSPNFDDSRNCYVLYAGGSGISPLYSILKTVLLEKQDSQVCLFYANRSLNSIIYYEELRELEAKYRGRLKIIFSLTEYDENWNGHKGRFNPMNVSVLIHRYAEAMFRDAEHYICGPQGMMKQIESALDVLSISKKYIRKESFTAPLANELGGNESKKPKMKLEQRVMKVKLYGEEHTITVEPDETMTASMQRHGAFAPFSCQIGACSTCRAKLVSGEMIMDEREALTDEEMSEGFILTCQAHPISDNCYVDFD